MPAVQILLRQQCRAVANPWKSARNARRIPNPGNVGALAPQDNQLMPKHRVLSLKPQLRLEWRGQDGQNETEQPDHSASLGDSVTSSRKAGRLA
jgi:hypothetical protein